MTAARPRLTEVADRLTRADGAALTLAIDPATLRVDVRGGNLDDITPAAREAILVGVQRAIALEAIES